MTDQTSTADQTAHLAGPQAAAQPRLRRTLVDPDFYIAAELIAGAGADIWFDASALGDEGAADTIANTQHAMQVAADMLPKLSEALRRLGSMIERREEDGFEAIPFAELREIYESVSSTLAPIPRILPATTFRLSHSAPLLTTIAVPGAMKRLVTIPDIGRPNQPAGEGYTPLAGYCMAVGMGADLPPGLDYHAVELKYHGGREQWMVENERHSNTRILPRDQRFGALSEMMAAFEELTGLELPEAVIHQFGVGILRCTSKGEAWDAENPYELKEGEFYTVTHRGETATIQAIEVMGVVYIAFYDSESHCVGPQTFNPRDELDSGGWKSLQRVDPPESLATREGRDAPRG